MIASSSSSSDDNLSLGAEQEEAPAAFSSVVPQCRGGVPS